MKKITILIPCYNEEKNIIPIYNETLNVIKNLNDYKWEFLFVDNCSTDGTQEGLRSLAAKDKRIKVILNQANYGITRSVCNGFFSSDGDAVIMLEADFEDPPQLIPEFVKAWEEGYKVVLAKYRSRQENPVVHMCRKLYYKIVTSISEVKLVSNVNGFGLYDRSALKVLESLEERDPRPRYIFTELGYQIKYILFDKPKRREGKSSFTLRSYYRVMVTSVIATSQAPLHMACLLGFVVSAVSFFIGLIYLVKKITLWGAFDWGVAPLIVGVFFIGGVQLFFIGIIGEYLGAVLTRLTKRPYVMERERINFDNADPEREKEEKE